MSLSTMLRGLRRPPAEATATELRTALAETEAQQSEAREDLARLDAARGDVLLEGDPDATAKHDADRREAQERWSRAKAIIGALLPRIEAAEAREAEAALQAEVAEVDRVAAVAVADVQAYERAAREMFAAADRINAASVRVAKMNATLRQIGRDELHVIPPLTRVWPHNAQDKLIGTQACGPRALARTLQAFEADADGAGYRQEAARHAEIRRRREEQEAAHAAAERERDSRRVATIFGRTR